jgi:hypothetical protein
MGAKCFHCFGKYLFACWMMEIFGVDFCDVLHVILFSYEDQMSGIQFMAVVLKLLMFMVNIASKLVTI